MCDFSGHRAEPTTSAEQPDASLRRRPVPRVVHRPRGPAARGAGEAVVAVAIVALLAGCGRTPAADAGQADAGADPGPDGGSLADVPLPGTPERRDVALSWTLESTAGEGGVHTQATLPLADGDLLVMATFSGSVRLGATVIEGTAERYFHHLAVRVRPDGTLRFARRVCDGCVGAAVEAPDGRIGTVTVASRLIASPGTPEELDLSSAKPGCALTVLTPDGAVQAMRRFGSCESAGLRAVAPAPDGGWFVGGHVRSASFDDGTVIDVPQDVFYPGRAFVAKLRADLSTEWVEPITGTAGSTVSMLAPWGDGVVAVGDFGGYPIGATAEFGRAPVVLEAVSSDDDPAMDVFVAAWTAPGRLAFARRVQHYGSERQATWLHASAAGFDFRLDGVGELTLRDGELFFGYGGADSVRLRFDAAGAFAGADAMPARAVPWPGARAWSTAWQAPGGTRTTLGTTPGALVFDTPASTGFANSAGWLLAHWKPEGTLGRAGQLVGEAPPDRSVPTLHGAAPQRDGAWLLYLSGSGALTLRPDAGAPATLEGSTYERMVFVGVRLVAP